MTWVAVGVAGASLIGGLFSSSAASKAASQQVAAERQALQMQQQMFQTTEGNEAPFVGLGQGAASQLNYLLGVGQPGVTSAAGGTGATAASSPAGGFGSLNTPFNMDTFKSLSPQYQFNLQQGGQGVLNQNSSAQGSESPAALSALMSYNQGFANNSFNSAFQNYQTQQNNVFDRLSNLANLGVNAGSAGTTGAASFANSIGNTASSIGASQASGTVGAANALTGGITSAANAFYGQNALNQILNSGSTVKYQSGGGSWSQPGANYDGSGNP
jgi:hypothetical protein